LFEGVELRDVRIGAHCVLDRLYFALRDPDWATVSLRLNEPVITQSCDGFLVRIEGTSEGAGTPFVFSVEFIGTADSFEARLRYRTTSDVAINRVGFCLLHPMSFAGSPLEVTGDTGTVRARFPDRIAPRSPFADFYRLKVLAAGAQVEMTFSGDLFEMEDQRNWIDASYKTFSTPLSRPIPRTLAAGAEGQQTVGIRWRPRELVVVSETVAVTQSRPNESPLPPSRPPLGLGASRSRAPVRASDIALLRSLAPAWLAVTLLLNSDWRSRWARAVEEANALGVPLDVTLVAGSHDAIDAWDPGKDSIMFGAIRLQAYDRVSHVTTKELAEALHALRDRLVWAAGARIAGGSRANFTELNRVSDRLPIDLLDEVAFAANPQVHAFDDASILQTPGALASAVRDALEVARGRPLLVGPLTLKPMFNAVAANPDQQDDLPPDPRQHDDVAGEWARLAIDASAGAAGVTIYETVGEWGVLDSSGKPSPAYRTLARNT